MHDIASTWLFTNFSSGYGDVLNAEIQYTLFFCLSGCKSVLSGDHSIIQNSISSERKNMSHQNAADDRNFWIFFLIIQSYAKYTERFNFPAP
jgi:hypothetical protein